MFTDGRITRGIRGVDKIWQCSIKLIAVTVFLSAAPVSLLSSKFQTLEASANKVQKWFYFYPNLSQHALKFLK